MAADILANVNGYGLASAKPTSPLEEGYLYFSTDTETLERYSGSAWQSIGSAPPSLNWWDTKHCQVLSSCVCVDGILLNMFGPELVSLVSGTVDISGVTGAGGFTELVVACSCMSDITPSNGQVRGYRADDMNVRADNGHYHRAVCRFPVDQHQSLFTGLADNNFWQNNNLAGFYKEDTDANWKCRSGNGTTIETTDSGVAWGTDDWHVFEVYVYDDGGTMTVKFWIDGTLIATHTTTCPTASELQLDAVVQSFWTNVDATTNDMVIFISEFFWATESTGHPFTYATL